MLSVQLGKEMPVVCDSCALLITEMLVPVVSKTRVNFLLGATAIRPGLVPALMEVAKSRMS